MPQPEFSPEEKKYINITGDKIIKKNQKIEFTLEEIKSSNFKRDKILKNNTKTKVTPEEIKSNNATGNKNIQKNSKTCLESKEVEVISVKVKRHNKNKPFMLKPFGADMVYIYNEDQFLEWDCDFRDNISNIYEYHGVYSDTHMCTDVVY